MNLQHLKSEALHFESHTRSLNRTNPMRIIPVSCLSLSQLNVSWQTGERGEGGFQQGRKLKPWEVSQPTWRSCCRREEGAAAVKCKCAIQALKTLLSQCRFTEVCFPGAWQPSWRQTGVLNPVKEPGWWQTWYPGFCWLPAQLQELLVSSLQGTLCVSRALVWLRAQLTHFTLGWIQHTLYYYKKKKKIYLVIWSRD